MTIDEAIDRLTELRGELVGEERSEKSFAVKLGIEALEELQRSRSIMARSTYLLLPGETED